MVLFKGDLIYVPSEVQLLQFTDLGDKHLDVEVTYVGPSPIKTYRLEKPSNLLLIENDTHDVSYVKVLYNGEEWYVSKKDIHGTILRKGE